MFMRMPKTPRARTEEDVVDLRVWCIVYRVNPNFPGEGFGAFGTGGALLSRSSNDG